MPDRDNRFSDELIRLRAEVKRLRARVKLLSRGLEPLLNRRGFIIYKKEPAEDLLVPSKRHLDNYYRLLHKYSFRLFLRDVIKHQVFFSAHDVTRYASETVTRGYLDKLHAWKLVRKRGDGFILKKQIRSFGSTLEWYIAELFRREFGSEAVWGVRFKRPAVGGDYDVIARIDSSLFYTEVKSSPPKQIYDSEIKAFLDRVDDLLPEIAVFFLDTELRMKDKIVPMFEKELAARSSSPPDVVRVERELFRIADGIFIVNAKESILQNLRQVFSSYYKRAGGDRLSGPAG